MNRPTLTTEANGRFSIQIQGYQLSLRTLAADINESQSHDPQFVSSGKRRGTIGGVQGEIETSTCSSNGVATTREIFVAVEKNQVAIKLAVQNQRDTAVTLNHLYPLSIEGDEGIRTRSGSFEDWRFVKTSRLKTDVPSSFDFSLDDENYFDAALEGERIKAGGGVTGKVEDFLNLESIRAEPFFYLVNKKTANEPGLLFGALGQIEHLTSFCITPNKGRDSLQSILCDCEFDGVQVDPGETRETHWMLISTFDDESKAAIDFNDQFANEFEIPAPPPTPKNIYCSWQYYGFDFNSQDLRENLDYLRKRPIPIDVLQLDNCWIDKMGDWNANHNFPEGMAHIAQLIKDAGYEPGIWTCPTVAQESSALIKNHPDVVAKNADGGWISFNSATGDTFSIDPTHPFFEEYIFDLYKKLNGWGYTYHKIDHIRSICLSDGIRFHDRKANRANAYRKMLQIVRDAVGHDKYLLACGGINDGGSAGLADALRTSNDMFGFWDSPDGQRWKGTLIKVKQNTIRNYTARLWHTDPDAAPLRRRTEYFRPDVVRADLSLGLFSDEEAFSIALVQYLTGGNTCISERFEELDDDRRKLMSHFMPATSLPCLIKDFSEKKCPNYFLTKVAIPDSSIEPWWTLAVGNWGDYEKNVSVDLSKLELPPEVENLAVFEFKEQKFLGLKQPNEIIETTIPSHGMLFFRLAKWDGQTPLIVGTSLHFSGGAMELAKVQTSVDTIEGDYETSWEYPTTISALFPKNDSIAFRQTVVQPDAKRFKLTAD